MSQPVSAKLDLSLPFQWDSSSSKTEDAFLYMQKHTLKYLTENVIEPAMKRFTSNVLKRMHVPCISDSLYSTTLIMSKSNKDGEHTCCFCGQAVMNVEHVAFVPNPYLQWINDTNCCFPFSSYSSNWKGTKQTFSMHCGNATLLFAAWRLIHFNYFIESNLLSSPVSVINDAILSSIETCISGCPSCFSPQVKT